MAGGNIAEKADRLQKACQNKMHPIWGYQRKLRTAARTKNDATKKTDGADCQGMSETMKRWEEWMAECIGKEKP